MPIFFNAQFSFNILYYFLFFLFLIQNIVIIQSIVSESKHSLWVDILEGAPQGPILRLLLFNIFLCDLFIVINTTYIASYADNSTAYVVKKR